MARGRDARVVAVLSRRPLAVAKPDSRTKRGFVLDRSPERARRVAFGIGPRSRVPLGGCRGDDRRRHHDPNDWHDERVRANRPDFHGNHTSELNSINPRLIPLIAHDRAGFGGATATAGLLTFASVWCAAPARALWQALLIGGIAGWASAILVASDYRLYRAAASRARLDRSDSLLRRPCADALVDVHPCAGRRRPMTAGSPRPIEAKLPTLGELGHDLLRVTAFRRLLTLGAPLAWIAGYVLFAHEHRWAAAVGCVMGLSFISYGSTSHDLVHHTLGLPSRLNNLLLTLIELLSLRSGTAYRLSHLHHHRHLLDCEDIEGTAAHGSLAGAILSGPGMQFRLWRWAWRTHPADRPALWGEAVAIATLAIGAIAALGFSSAPFIYARWSWPVSWTFPADHRLHPARRTRRVVNRSDSDVPRVAAAFDRV